MAQELAQSVGKNDPPKTTLFRRTMRAFLRSPGGKTGAILVGLFLAISVLGPQIITKDPYVVDLLQSLERPSARHLFGTDELGRDIFSRVIMGTRISLTIALVGVLIALIAGVTLGSTAGYFGGLYDTVLMRVVDVLLAFPSFLLAVVTINSLGPGLVNTMIAVGISSVPQFARVARGSILSVKEKEFITSAGAAGATNLRIIIRHCLPNIVSPMVVQSTLRLSTMILTAAGMSFIGLGVQSPLPEWGKMMSESRSVLVIAPHAVFFPGAAIFLAVLGFNLLGDALTDALDPRQHL